VGELDEFTVPVPIFIFRAPAAYQAETSHPFLNAARFKERQSARSRIIIALRGGLVMTRQAAQAFAKNGQCRRPAGRWMFSKLNRCRPDLPLCAVRPQKILFLNGPHPSAHRPRKRKETWA